jgi:hypothetical protein
MSLLHQQKKTYMRYLAHCFSILVLFGLIACSDDGHSIEKDIKGVWAQETYMEDVNHISRGEYHFKDDGQLEVLRIELDIDSREVLGYRSRILGNYGINGNKLSFYNLVMYSNDDTTGPFTELENLTKVAEGGAYDVTCQIEERGKKLTFIYPPCGPLENCIGTITLMKAD